LCESCDKEGNRTYCPPLGLSLRLAKRTIDVSLSIVGLLLTAPLMLFVAAITYLTSGPPILFRQQRIGWREHPFEIVKFRTMRPARADEVALLTDAARVSWFGRFLRSSSLDELPELWNVLRGDMSLVGPRPLLAEHLPLYSPDQRRRHCVRPGMTGLAQVSGRQSIPFSKRLELDVQYVEGVSIRTDARILLQTLRMIVKRSDIITGQEISQVDDIGLLSRIRDESSDREPS
jgi:sugar transferase EpsL